MGGRSNDGFGFALQLARRVCRGWAFWPTRIPPGLAVAQKGNLSKTGRLTNPSGLVQLALRTRPCEASLAATCFGLWTVACFGLFQGPLKCSGRPPAKRRSLARPRLDGPASMGPPPRREARLEGEELSKKSSRIVTRDRPPSAPRALGPFRDGTGTRARPWRGAVSRVLQRGRGREGLQKDREGPERGTVDPLESKTAS
mmetsp:Transcript_24819/g.83421  ORF Transcript_24819/g.83421 Transcript_24819/m.83421 type:complete len:200 (+) Transcript_24819:29-628(+)